MSELELAEDAKRSNILDMALTFTAMMRVFAKGSKERIARQLGELTSGLPAITSAEEYERTHKAFCECFCREVRTAERKLRSGKTRPGRPASFGQAAKILDIVLKVYVFYCSQPSSDVASRIGRFLHGAVDTPIMNYLKRKYPEGSVRATTIEQVDEQTYRTLQGLLTQDIKDRFHGGMLPVQYDDIMWQELNRGTEAQA